MSFFDRFRPSPPWRQSRIWALDLETTGLEPGRDRILTVGMVPLVDGVIRWSERAHERVRHDGDAASPAASLRVHHILPDELRDGDDLATVLERVLARLEGSLLLVHYQRLDVGFLREACHRTRRPWPEPKVVDTVRLMRRYARRVHFLDPHAPHPPTDLAGARRELGLPAHAEHDALHDALATAELFLALAARLDLETVRELR